MCLIVISKIMAKSNRVDKYVLYDDKKQEITVKTPSELSELIDSGHNIVGLRKGGPLSVTPTRYFTHIGIIGDEESGGDERFTVIKQRLSKTHREYEVSDRTGNVSIWSREELMDKIKEHQPINGARIVNNKLLVAQTIPTLILK